MLKEFASLVSEVTNRLVREHHEVVAHGEAGIVPVAVLLDGTSVGGVPGGGSTACQGRTKKIVEGGAPDVRKILREVTRPDQPRPLAPYF